MVSKKKGGGWNKGISSFRGSKLKETGLKPIDQDSQHHTHSKKSGGGGEGGGQVKYGPYWQEY